MSLEQTDESETGSYFDLLRQAILSLPENSIINRRRIYAGLENELAAHLKSQGLPDSDAELEYRLLRQTVRLLERDIRTGSDIAAPGYRPDGLWQAQQALFRSRDVKHSHAPV